MTKSKGFTLIELLVVIAVIGILAAIALISLTGLQRSARDSNRKSNVSDYATALARYYQDNQAYPGSAAAGDNDNTGGGQGIFGGTSVLVSGNYMPKVLHDPSVGQSNCKPNSGAASQTCQYLYIANQTTNTASAFTIFAVLEAPGGSTSTNSGVFYVNDKGTRGLSPTGAVCASSYDTTNCP